MMKIDTKKPYCVYTHSDGAEVFYVGSGKFPRPILFHKNYRTKLWRKKFQNIKEIFVEIVSWHKSKEEARNSEVQLIKKIKPSCNVTYLKRVSRKKHTVNKPLLNRKPSNSLITIDKINAWLQDNNIQSVELARYLGVSKYAVSKWRERGVIPRRLEPILLDVVELDRRSLQRHLARRSPELF